MLTGIHTGKWHSGVYHIDLQSDDTYVDEAVQFDMSREEVKQFFDLMRNGKFLRVHQDEHGIIYELVRRSFRDYCWGLQRRSKKRKKLKWKTQQNDTSTLQGNRDH